MGLGFYLARNQEKRLPKRLVHQSNLSCHLFCPGLCIVPVHQLASVRFLPSLDTSGQDQSLDVGLAYFVEVVLHPVGRTGTSGTTAPYSRACEHEQL